MSTARSAKLKVKRPKNAFRKPLQADLKNLFAALSKGIGHASVGKWEELGNDTVEALSAIGLATEPGELAFLLIRRALARALFDLITESGAQQWLGSAAARDEVLQKLDLDSVFGDVSIGADFLDNPAQLALLRDLQRVLEDWLAEYGVPKASASAMAARLPTYFVYALNAEWRANSKSYRLLVEALRTPFSRAGDQEWAWTEYAYLLQRRTQEGVFGEPFSLAQIYVPLNAYIEESADRKFSDEVGSARSRRRVVVDLEDELNSWLLQTSTGLAIRVLSGGPGSGKSSFARIFAAKVAMSGSMRVLFIPLHLIDASKDLVDEVGRFIREEGVLPYNPLEAEAKDRKLFVIFDGLDELASQGKAAAETARAFVREIERTVERRNGQNGRILRVLISGRELVVQENESEFRRPRQILTLLPYFVPRGSRAGRSRAEDSDSYHDPKELLRKDLRQVWWRNYGALTGKGYPGLPGHLNREDLEEVTGQPLLNYLIALSFSREKVDFRKDINLNTVYEDLVAAVHERGYEKGRLYGPIRHMKMEEFSRVLEEVGLAAWHGDGRSTTVREIEEHCRTSGLGSLLSVFQDGAKAGVTRLLAAFFFRQHGQRSSGDPTFVFTHKSFGEYLTARRVIRAVERVVRELRSREEDPDRGWDEREALKHWIHICGPSAVTQYLHAFLLNEVKLRPGADLLQWQEYLARLFSYMLRHGMPMEQTQVAPFRVALFQSRNAEEALLVALNACSRTTGKVASIDYPDVTALGAWFRRIQGQRSGPESVLAARCLSFLDFGGACLDIIDLYGANVGGSNLRRVVGHFACLAMSNFSGARLEGARFSRSDFTHANMKGAKLARASLLHSKFERADLEGANLAGAKLLGSDFRQANLQGANLKGASLDEVDFTGANLRHANLEGADVHNANLANARTEGTIGIVSLKETSLRTSRRRRRTSARERVSEEP